MPRPSASKKTRKSTPRRKATAKPAKAGRSPRGKAKPRKGSAKVSRAKPSKAARPSRPQAPMQGGNVHAHCSATDPFGDSCQNLPRRPSTYCVIHSYLDR